MDPSKLPRDPVRCRAAVEVTKADTMVALVPCRIYIPTRYKEKALAVVGDEIRVLATFCFTAEDACYSVWRICAKMQLTPTSMTTVKVNGDEFFEFYFEAGQTICPNLNLVRHAADAYNLYDEVIAKGHIPWYFGYEDIGKLLLTAPDHAGITLAANNVPLEIIAAAITRSRKDRTIYYRHTVDTLSDVHRLSPAFIAFRSIMYGATNVTAKLMGSYFDEGLLSSLVQRSERKEDVETLLRQ